MPAGGSVKRGQRGALVGVVVSQGWHLAEQDDTQSGAAGLRVLGGVK